MRKIIDFIFHGETFVSEEGLESFLENAKDLQFEGLSAAITTNKSLEELINDSDTNEENPSKNTVIKSEPHEPIEPQMVEVQVEFPDDPLDDGKKVRITEREGGSNMSDDPKFPFLED